MQINKHRRAIRSTLASLLVFCVSPSVSFADSFGSLELLSQEQFRTLSENTASAIHYKAVSPAEPLGIIGFDVGIEISSTEIDEALFDLASDGDFDAPELIVPRLHVLKGLPFGIDIGASYSEVPDTDVSILAGELRYALLGGGVVTPALAIRLSHTRLQGLDDFEMDSTAVEITGSKGFLMFTPYIGAGIVKTNASPKNIGTLSEESFDQNKLFAGVTINLGLAVTLEVDETGDYRTYSAKAGFRF